MAKGRKVTVDLRLPTEEEGRTTGDDLDALLAELPAAAASITLSRRNDKNPTQWDYCTKIPVNEFDLEAVKREFGGGIYRGQVKQGTGQMVRQFTFSIESRFVPQAFQQPAAGPGAQAIALQEEAMENRKLFRDLLLALAARPAGGNDLDTAIKLATLLKGDSTSGGATVRDLLAMFQQGMQLGADRQPLSDSFGGVVSAASPLLNAIAKNLEAQVEERRRVLGGGAPVRESSVQGPLSPAGGPPRTESGPVSGPYSWLGKVQPYFAQLVNLAKLDKDPELYADVVLDQLPDEFVAELEEAAKDPAFVQEVLSRVSEARMYRGWFEAFLTRLRAQLLDEDQPSANGNGHREGT